jgi:hypothetical protein
MKKYPNRSFENETTEKILKWKQNRWNKIKEYNEK